MGSAAAPLLRKPTEEAERAAPVSAVARAPVSIARSADPGRSAMLSTRAIQAKNFISSPEDASEREADRVADHVMAMKKPAPKANAASTARTVMRSPLIAQRAPAALKPAAAKAAAVKPPAAKAGAKPVVSDQTPIAAEVKAAAVGGFALSNKTRAFMEPRFRADFSGVMIHTDETAKRLSSKIGARAFTYGRHIFFNDGQYNPDSQAGLKLLAHELTHTIQQSETIQLKPLVHERTGPQIQPIGNPFAAIADAVGGAIDAVGEFVGDVIQIVKDFAAEHAEELGGFRILCLVLGYNPINDAPAPGGGRAILKELAGFIPFGDKVYEALNNHGIIDKGGAFIDTQLAAFKSMVSAVVSAIGTFFTSLGPADALNPIGAWNRAKAIFSPAIANMKSFASGLISGFIDLVREVIVKPMARWAAANIPKWDLLMAVLGQNPVSNDSESPAMTIIGAFMTLIGQEEVWTNIKKGNAIGRAWTWFQTALKGAKSLVSDIPGLVMGTIRSLTIVDVLTVVGAAQKIVGAFAGFVVKFGSWALGTVFDLLKIIIEVVAPEVMVYIKKAGGAFKTIVENPGRFVSTLIAAGKQGFAQFAANFLTHLKASLIQWLTGSLAGAGVYIPSGFSFMEILKFVLSVMGLTWQNIRGKLVRATNEATVVALETGFDIVRTLVTEGPAAAWQKIMETLSNLKQMAIDAIMDFVKGKIVEIAMKKLATLMAGPAGAFIEAVLAIYNTVMFFIERLRQIAAVAAAFIDGIAAIAAGNIAPAANKVESTMAGLLTLVISFLARLAGLGRVSDAIIGLINRIRAPIERALDAVVAWIVAQARRLGRFILQAGVPADPNARLRLAMRDAGVLARGLGNRISRETLERALGVLRTRYSLTGLTVAERNRQWYVTATINPTLSNPVAPVAGSAGSPPRPMPAQTTRITVTPPFVKGRNLQNQQAEYDRQVGLQEAGINGMNVAEWERNRASYVARRSAPGSRSGRDPATATDQANLRARVLDEMTRRLQLARNATAAFPSLGAYELGQMMGIYAANATTGTPPNVRDNIVQGFTAGQAASLAGGWLRTQHALHSPDQVAGGSRLDASGAVSANQGLTGVGLANVNMSIGSQWGTSGQARVQSISTQLSAFLATAVPGGPPVTTDAEKSLIRMNVSMLPVL